MPARDTGLQAERTALAWGRTALAVLANAVLALRFGWVAERQWIMALAVALLVAAGVVHVQGVLRRAQLLTSARPAAPSAMAIGVVAAIAMLASAIGLLSVLAPGIDSMEQARATCGECP
jgi:uncharacterized membrane protein YidH (DUF202 family)